MPLYHRTVLLVRNQTHTVHDSKENLYLSSLGIFRYYTCSKILSTRPILASCSLNWDSDNLKLNCFKVFSAPHLCFLMNHIYVFWWSLSLLACPFFNQCVDVSESSKEPLFITCQCLHSLIPDVCSRVQGKRGRQSSPLTSHSQSYDQWIIVQLWLSYIYIYIYKTIIIAL